VVTPTYERRSHSKGLDICGPVSTTAHMLFFGRITPRCRHVTGDVADDAARM